MGILKKAARAVKSLFRWRYRSSKTGKFVTRDFAEHHPATTQRETAE